MILINKKITPEAKRAINAVLKGHGKKAHFTHLGGTTPDEKEKNDVSGKIKVGQSLVAEQGYLCAYCMRRIEKAEKIEHWTAQKDLKDKPNETLNYDILLAVCSGETDVQGGIKPIRHCDTKRSEFEGDNAELTINPTKAYLMQFIKYGKNGQMFFESIDNELNSKVNDDIIDRLGLDINPNKEDNIGEYVIRQKRLSVYKTVESLRNAYKTRYPKDFSKKLEDYIQQNWEERDKEGKLKEYCGIVIYFKKQLTRPYF
jgi:uncharacterized protein (TIGR02646 family)